MMTFRGKEEEESKSPETELSGDVAWKLSVLLTESDDESELSDEGLVEEDKLEEIMQELYREITIASSSSYNTSPLPFSAVSGVNGESCGASMSDLSSTVMAGIEFVAAPTGKYLAKNELTNNDVGGEEDVEMDGCDEGEIDDDDDDDQWLARVLGWVPLELEESPSMKFAV
ncbi:hypothetical protein HRI_004431900 [Hibiscus trionum]|uniref:Uncharacterized protein n=1 Tax=Hibiscus trionum TaxID=183268 RepID=A0A9W7J439_HIBTR|nr:hypothetical protein HRI_004431900 [Hibiscus trionum]